MRIAPALGILMGTTCIAVAGEYRLVHSIGNDETTLRMGLTEEECRRLRADFLESTVIIVQVSEEDPNSGALDCVLESDS